MIIQLNERQIAAAIQYLDHDEDAERLSDGGYTCDLYEIEAPITMELYPMKGGFDVTAAFYLAFSDELNGYYLGEKIDAEQDLLSALKGWAPLCEK